MFGPILSCDMLLDPMGRPLHEAEVEFMYPQSAQECVAKLDGEIADGNYLLKHSLLLFFKKKNLFIH
jgi:hypothetical protein